ncbi:MAG: SDR family oxidoreductase [Propionibacteriaceae bacterium]|nr:SDR family oxidoreductase [Propionibacteriaceae bacterium]
MVKTQQRCWQERNRANMDLGLTGKTAIVIGGSSNIGRASVLALSREGANVVIAARNAANCEAVAAKASGKTLVVSTDATQYEQVQALADKTMDTFGAVDIVVGSMGWDSPGDFLTVDRSEWAPVIESNYVAMLNWFHVFLPIMLRQKSGTIITVSSVMGRRADSLEPVYAGTKAAQILFSQCMARQHSPAGVRINVVAPGPSPIQRVEDAAPTSLWLRAEQGEVGWAAGPDRDKGGPALVAVPGGPQASLLAATPLGKFGTAEDTAAAVVFLASEVASGHMTGQVLGVDGGMFMPR